MFMFLSSLHEIDSTVLRTEMLGSTSADRLFPRDLRD